MPVATHVPVPFQPQEVNERVRARRICALARIAELAGLGPSHGGSVILMLTAKATGIRRETVRDYSTADLEMAVRMLEEETL